MIGHEGAQALSGWSSRTAHTIGSRERRGVRMDCTRNGHSLRSCSPWPVRVGKPAGRFMGSGATRRLKRQAPSGARLWGPLSSGPEQAAGNGQSRPFRRGAVVSVRETLEDRGSGTAPQRERRWPPLENSSSSLPIRANTRLIGWLSGQRRRSGQAVRESFPGQRLAV